MKKLIPLFLLIFTFGVNSYAFAQFNGPGLTPITVAEALELKDDTPVVLIGKIEKNLGNEHYLFSDSTGSITVEIDYDDWRGVVTTPEDTIEIHGEIDKDFTNIEVDVDYVIKK